MLRAQNNQTMKQFRVVLWGLSLSLASCAGIQSRYHTVRAGDSLAKIAARTDVSVSALKESNSGILLAGLKPGQKLYIPFEDNPQWDKDLYETSPREIAEDSSMSDLKISHVSFNWPVKGPVSSKFGKRYMRGRGRHFHEGIDIAARKGAPVKSARAGHVVYATNRISGYGNMVIVQHADKYSTVYAHLTKIGVKKGQFVTRGGLLGTVGRTGRTTGSHLHFEVREARMPVDPMPFLFQKYAGNP